MKIYRLKFLRVAILTVVFACSACDNSSILTFETTGADRLRPFAIVSFPTDLESGNYLARDHTGETASLQVDEDGSATFFIYRALPRAVTRWTVSRSAIAPSHVTAEQVGEQIKFKVDDRAIVAYQISNGEVPRDDIPEVFLRNGYLHPVWTPSGQIVTDDYPPDHIHHHGIWAAWTNTIFQGRRPDFWNMGQGTGRVEVNGLDSLWSGSVYGGLHARHDYIDMTDDEAVVLNESWRLNVYNVPIDLNILDLELIQTTATDSALVLVEHRYGGVGVRGYRNWKGKNETEFFTSEGLTREDGHATRARWCHIGGLIDDESAGIAVLSHPDNHESPQSMRIHPTEPFFNFAPTQAGTFEITPDMPIEWKYRFVTYDGNHDRELLDALWEDYANPLDVQIIN